MSAAGVVVMLCCDKSGSKRHIQHRPEEDREPCLPSRCFLCCFSVAPCLCCEKISIYRLMADLRGSPIVAKGSRPPSLGTIHFFSLAIISSSSFLSSALGMYSFRCSS